MLQNEKIKKSGSDPIHSLTQRSHEWEETQTSAQANTYIASTFMEISHTNPHDNEEREGITDKSTICGLGIA